MKDPSQQPPRRTVQKPYVIIQNPQKEQQRIDAVRRARHRRQLKKSRSRDSPSLSSSAQTESSERDEEEDSDSDSELVVSSSEADEPTTCLTRKKTVTGLPPALCPKGVDWREGTRLRFPPVVPFSGVF